ncbi:hypothetical protein D3C72_2230890 [compost metagenome]
MASSAILAVVTFASASLTVVIELLLIFAAVIALFAIVGFGNVPVRSPPALPLGARLVGAPDSLL